VDIQRPDSPLPCRRGLGGGLAYPPGIRGSTLAPALLWPLYANITPPPAAGTIPQRPRR
jgi:hypothetical protein